VHISEIKLLRYHLADNSKKLTQLYHHSGMALIIIAPLAFVISPSKFNFPIDLALGIVFPFHSHVAFNYIISDYVPKSLRSAARMSLLGITIFTAAGLLKLNVQGPGITETFKSLWKKKKSTK
jgi:succinate dehydrogenase (ubiquinone) membrane anchor subunit